MNEKGYTEMRRIIKKITIAVCTALTAIMLVAAPVLATGEVSGAVQGSAANTTGVTSNIGTSVGQQAVSNGANSVTAQTSTATANKKYVTGWGVFFWFLISVIVNFVISCWIGNRFYRMAKKSAQSSNEIRALRKDIEERFGATIKDIDEPAIEVLNSNESYARDGEGISMPERKAHVELNDDEREMMRRWDTKRTSARVSSFDTEAAEDEAEAFEEERRPVRRSYKPTRRSSGIEFEDAEEVYEDGDEAEETPRERTAPRRGGKGAEALTNAKNKAKDFLSNVFPFEE